MKTWSNEQVEILKKSYENLTPTELSRLIGKTKKAIINKAYLLGISKEKRRWTDMEDEYLNLNIGTLSINHICKRLNRTKLGVYQRLEVLGINGVKDNIEFLTARMLSKLINKDCKTVLNWIKNEKLIAKKVKVTNNKNGIYKIMIEDFWEFAYSNKNLLKFGLIGKNSIVPEPEWVEVERRKESDIINFKRWTEKEIEYLKTLFKNGYSDESISRLIKKSIPAIKSKRHLLQLGKTIPIKWERKEIDIVFDMIKKGKNYRLIAEELGRDYSGVRAKILRMKNNGTYEYFYNNAGNKKMGRMNDVDANELNELFDI